MRLLALIACAVGLSVAAGCLSASVKDRNDVIGAATASAPGDGDCLRFVKGVDLQNSTIADLQREMAAGNVSSVDLVDAYVARFLAYDEAGPRLNSIQVLAADARTQAAALDAERAAGRVRGPLHGIPVLLKDNVGTSDMPTTAGSIALAKNVPPSDATLTGRLRQAGAIVFGKAQLSEFAYWMSLTMPSGYSSLGGQVVNAYNGGDPSGSSSGSGVAGSMAFAAATIGTETSGSILSPSNANSVVGVKTTLGLVSRAGVIPLAENFDVPGPMVRHVWDAAAMLGAIAGPDPKDPATAGSGEHLPAGGDYTAALRPDALEGVRLGYEPRDNALFNEAIEDLERLGATLVPIEAHPAEPVSLTEIPLIFNEFKYGINRYLAEEAGPGLPVNDLTGIILYNQEHPDRVKYGQELLIISDATPGVGPLAEVASIPTVAGSGAVANSLFTDNDVDALIGPDAPYTSLGAAAGYPTVTVPSGYNGKNPQGLSFFGPAWSEERLLSYAYAYEQGTMKRLPPTVVNPSLVDGACPAAPDPPEEGSRVQTEAPGLDPVRHFVERAGALQ